MDEAIKNVTQFFKRSGLWDDTVVFFTTGEKSERERERERGRDERERIYST